MFPPPPPPLPNLVIYTGWATGKVTVHVRSQVAKLLDKIFEDWSGQRHWNGLSGTEGTRTQAWLQDACLQVSSKESETSAQQGDWVNNTHILSAAVSGLAILQSSLLCLVISRPVPALSSDHWSTIILMNQWKNDRLFLEAIENTHFSTALPSLLIQQSFERFTNFHYYYY